MADVDPTPGATGSALLTYSGTLVLAAVELCAYADKVGLLGPLEKASSPDTVALAEANGIEIGMMLASVDKLDEYCGCVENDSADAVFVVAVGLNELDTLG